MLLKEFSEYNLNKSISFHKDSINCIIILYDQRLCSCSDDKKINIYNKETHNIDLIISEFNDDIYHLNQLSSNNNNILLACSYELIKLFEIKNNSYKRIQMIENFVGWVYKSIELNNYKIATCGAEKKIKFWEKFNDKYVNSMTINYFDWIEDILEYEKNKIISSSALNEEITFWDLDNNKILGNIKKIESTEWNNNLNKLNNEIILVNGKEYLYLINFKNFELVNKIKTEFQNYCNLKLKDNNIIIGDKKGNISEYIYDENNKSLNLKIFKKSSHNGCIFSIILNDNKEIISASEDKTIKFWK
jgi:WD40 repeat protein